MKKISLFMAAAAVITAGMVSCNKENTLSSSESEEKVNISVGLSGLSIQTTDTKASGDNVAASTDEKNVNNLQVFVFRTDGKLDAYGTADQNTLSLACTTGEKEIYALVNAPSLSSISSKSALLSTTSKLSENSRTGLQMIGKKTETISASTTVTIEVRRFAARVAIDNIITNFSSAAYQGQTFIVKGIYLINVAGDRNSYPVDEASSPAYNPTIWYNKRAYSSSDIPDLIAHQGIDKTLTHNTAYAANEKFYCYPNPTSTDTSNSTWSSRYTRLVVEATLGGVTYYYPISIPGIESNKTYTITQLTITKPGSTDPDVPISSEECTFNLDVKDWVEGSSYAETI